MIKIDEKTYRQAARLLMAAIGTENYFNGTINIDSQPFNSHLTATLLIYRNDDGSPHEIVPVWWEFHTTGLTGEINTDFSWNQLKNYFSHATI